MLRAFVVLPVYLACLYFAPQVPLYVRFHEAVVASGRTYLQYHVYGYMIGLGVSVVLALLMTFAWKPRTYAQGVLHAVFRMGVIGLVFCCAYQLFMFYTAGELTVFALLVPVMFMAAELIYEFVAFVFASFARLFGIKIQSA
jgi:hypothetical protein